MTATDPGGYFTPATFRFLRRLAKNNTKEWFEAHRDVYESEVREPALRFIEAVGPGLKRLSPRLVADPARVGGSLFRMNRDARFKTEPGLYRTSVGMAFALGGRGDSDSTSLYLFVEPGRSWAGGGVRRPTGPTLRRLRDAIVASPAAWRRALAAPGFAPWFPPEPAAPARRREDDDDGHPLVADLRRRSFTWRADLSDTEVCEPGLPGRYLELCRRAAPFTRFVARALGEAW